jgi:hypothetical protein
MKLVVLDDLLVSVSRAGSKDGGMLSESDMAQFIEKLRHAPVKKLISCLHGSSNSSSVQRKEGADLIKSRNIEVAVITDDRLVRGFVTALSWLGAKVHAFSWADIGAALKHLDVQNQLADDALSAISKFSRDLGVD